ncbi:MAG: hypothetical protein M3O87_06815, partial [Candidatus Dormibacteraeota bacterium]|nr:hypothetical protein [Candidatus Dormibacteraeota bacterium]
MGVLALFAVLIFAAYGPLGTNLTDEGLIQDWGYRILHGALPHRDFISPRPLGSALIHLPELLGPQPLLLTARLLMIAEIVAYSALLASIVYRTPLRRWNWKHLLGVLVSALVSLHTFALMEWETVDGLLLTSIAARLLLPLERQNTRKVVVAMLCIGLALTTKQSFAPALPLALLFIAPAPGQGLRRWTRHTVGLVVALVPVGAYAGWVAAGGGLSEMLRQFLAAGKVDWLPFLSALQSPLSAVLVALMVAILGILLSPVPVRVRGQDLALHTPLLYAAILAILALPMFVQRLGPYTSWGYLLQWALMGVLAVDLLFRRTLPRDGLWILAMSYAVELSFGYSEPSLVCGAIVLFIAYRLDGWRTEDNPRASGRIGRLVWNHYAWLVPVVAMIGLSGFVRTIHVYGDAPVGQLTATVTPLMPAYAGIRTNPTTATALNQVAVCSARMPAGKLSVIPDFPTAALALGKQPAVPISILWEVEYKGSESRLIDAIDQL